MSRTDYLLYQQRQQQQAAVDQRCSPVSPEKPFISGATLTDIPKGLLNALVAVPTDMVDLGLGLTDVARATASSAGLGDFGWDQVFDDGDNPLTKARRDSIGNFDTGAGELFGTGARIATLIGSLIYSGRLDRLPLIGLRGQKFLRLAQMPFKGVGRGIDKLDDAVMGANKARNAANTATGLKRVQQASQATSGLNRAATLASKNAYLQGTFKTIAEIPEATSWWKSTVQVASSYAKAKVRPKTVAETFAWDMFAAFNLMGEGDTELDETVFDMASTLGMDVPADLVTRAGDTAWDRKMKGLLDGLLIGSVGGGLVDLFRLRRYARRSSKQHQSNERFWLRL